MLSVVLAVAGCSCAPNQRIVESNAELTESNVNRAAGPVRSTAAKSIPGFETIEGGWDHRAPLGWDVRDADPTARAVVALLSDWFPATTGEIVHVDGGVHAMGQ